MLLFHFAWCGFSSCNLLEFLMWKIRKHSVFESICSISMLDKTKKEKGRGYEQRERERGKTWERERKRMREKSWYQFWQTPSKWCVRSKESYRISEWWSSAACKIFSTLTHFLKPCKVIDGSWGWETDEQVFGSSGKLFLRPLHDEYY